MARLLTNSMHWFWKISFVAAAFWTLFILPEMVGIDRFGAPSLGNDDVVKFFAPLMIWIVTRWLSIGN
ncbi:MAG: hypothetical protein P8H30_06030 [Luminiphilus sp.]|jgi:hypothetical protein|nr:hypothetical protein [Luminiphilus sp.]MDG1460098.1 hypothetical protein [Luminiphilus sp.]MDG1771505.1 hypothetical protein [Luminiphilus sp.]